MKDDRRFDHIELCPCPFCAGEAWIVISSAPNMVLYTAGCSQCGAKGEPKGDPEEAGTAWNKRTAIIQDKEALIEMSFVSISKFPRYKIKVFPPEKYHDSLCEYVNKFCEGKHVVSVQYVLYDQKTYSGTMYHNDSVCITDSVPYHGASVVYIDGETEVKRIEDK